MSAPGVPRNGESAGSSGASAAGRKARLAAVPPGRAGSSSHDITAISRAVVARLSVATSARASPGSDARQATPGPSNQRRARSASATASA